MKKLFLLVLTLSGLHFSLSAQNVEEFLVWPQGAPSSNGITAQESSDQEGRAANISVARMYVYHPAAEKNTGKAVVICPGGGYGIVAMWHEGDLFARWLAERGVTGIVLKYRLPNQHPEVPLADAGRAIRTVRSKAVEWGISLDKIGIAGFSAGGHLASTAGTHFDAGKQDAADPVEKVSSRPDFMILFYPVISLSEKGITHMGSRYGLLGPNPSQELIDYYSNEKQVSSQTPPTFLVHSDDDNGVSPLNSVRFYEALKRTKVPAVLHILNSGGHGWGIRESFVHYGEWTALLDAWLNQLK